MQTKLTRELLTLTWEVLVCLRVVMRPMTPKAQQCMQLFTVYKRYSATNSLLAVSHPASQMPYE